MDSREHNGMPEHTDKCGCKDSERMDWLDEESQKLLEEIGPNPLLPSKGVHLNIKRGETSRQTIDRAMAVKKGGKE